MRIKPSTFSGTVSLLPRDSYCFHCGELIREDPADWVEWEGHDSQDMSKPITIGLHVLCAARLGYHLQRDALVP